MADKVYFSINAKKINYDCPSYQQDVDRGLRYCIDTDVLRFIGAVNDSASDKTRKARVYECLGCKNFGMTAIKNEKHLTKERVLKIRAGQTLDLSLTSKQIKKKREKYKYKDVFAEEQ